VLGPVLQYDWLVREKIADGALISKWRKPGYELLCSTLAINKGNHNFGTTSHCRVPLKLRAAAQRITPNVQSGCISCASGDGKFGGPIWWNTPLDEDDQETAEQNRATWAQPGMEDAGERGTAGAAVGRAGSWTRPGGLGRWSLHVRGRLRVEAGNLKEERRESMVVIQQQLGGVREGCYVLA
jgi:hypothetical protein